MGFIGESRASHIRIWAVAVLGALVAACASAPPGNAGAQQSSSQTPGGASTTYTGRLELTVTDQNAAPLDRANVQLHSMGPGSYRSSSTTDGLGRVTFNNVPPQVEIEVVAQNGSGRQTEVVSQEGTTPARMIVQTYGDTTQQDPGAAGAGAGGGGLGAGGGGRGRR